MVTNFVTLREMAPLPSIAPAFKLQIRLFLRLPGVQVISVTEPPDGIA